MLNSFSEIDYLNFDYNYMKLYTQAELDYAVAVANRNWYQECMDMTLKAMNQFKSNI